MDELDALVSAAQQGNLAAFDGIVQRFQDMAFAVAYARLGHPQQAEDAAQEAFLEAFIHLSKLEDVAAFPGWFRTIVHRQCSRLTRGKRLNTMPLEHAADISSNTPDPATVVVTTETRAWVHDAIEGLPINERQVTLLYYIADYSQHEVADFLGLRVSTVKSRLHTARNRLREGMIDMVEENLHEQRPSKDERFASRVMDIIHAAEEGDLARLEALLGREPELAQVRSTTGRTLLHIITDWPGHKPNRAALTRALLHAGADPNARFEGEHRETPLHWAASSDDVEAIDALLDGGAEIDADGAVIGSGTPLTDAVFFGQMKAAQRLVERGATVNLPLAAGLGRLDLMAQFFAAEGELRSHAGQLRTQNTSGHVALSGDEAKHLLEEAFAYACLAGQIEAARFLLDRGVDINSMALDEHSRRTGLHWAVYRNKPEMVQFLIARGADLTKPDERYKATPLGWAQHHNLKEMEAILAGSGASDPEGDC